MNRGRMTAISVAAALFLGVWMGGCSKKDEELDRQIQDQINLIEREVKAVEQHQAAMQELVKQMQAELTALQEELNREAPRINAANSGVKYLRELTTIGFGESPASSTLRHPNFSWIWVLFFILLLLLFYRLRSSSQSRE